MAASNLSLFGGRKLIDLRIPTGKPAGKGNAAIRICQRCTPDTLLLVTLPALDWKDESCLVTALAEGRRRLKLNAPPLAELPAWIAGRLQRQGQGADRGGTGFHRRARRRQPALPRSRDPQAGAAPSREAADAGGSAQAVLDVARLISTRYAKHCSRATPHD